MGNILELRSVRRQLDGLASRRLQGQLAPELALLYSDLCQRERQLLTACHGGSASAA